MRRDITALDLMVGDRVRDDYGPWAEVVTVEDTPGGVRVEWKLANGRRDVTTNAADDRFTLIRRDHPDPWATGGKFVDDAGLEPVEDEHGN